MTKSSSKDLLSKTAKFLQECEAQDFRDVQDDAMRTLGLDCSENEESSYHYQNNYGRLSAQASDAWVLTSQLLRSSVQPMTMTWGSSNLQVDETSGQPKLKAKKKTGKIKPDVVIFDDITVGEVHSFDEIYPGIPSS